MRFILLVSMGMLLPWSADAHEEAANLGHPSGWTGQGTLAASYRSLSKVKSSERWIIPGHLMGGEALPMPRGFHLDEVMLSASYGQDSTYAYLKLGQHVGADGLEVEHALVGQRLGTNEVLEIGKMSSAMTPYHTPHPSQTPFADPLLVYDALWGRQYNDVGMRVRSLLWNSTLEAGLELWQGDAFPAERKDSAKGAFDAYLLHRMRMESLSWRLGVFHYQGEANTRKDDRYSSEHSHGLDTTTIPVYWFSGRTKVQGFHAALEYGANVKWGGEGEIHISESEGDLRDATRLAPIETRYLGYWWSVFVTYSSHLAAVRCERLQFENNLSGSAATVLATQANLVADTDPYRISVAYNWQWTPSLKLRAEWVRDFTSVNEKDMGIAGIVWFHQVQAEALGQGE